MTAADIYSVTIRDSTFLVSRDILNRFGLFKMLIERSIQKDEEKVLIIPDRNPSVFADMLDYLIYGKMLSKCTELDAIYLDCGYYQIEAPIIKRLSYNICCVDKKKLECFVDSYLRELEKLERDMINVTSCLESKCVKCPECRLKIGRRNLEHPEASIYGVHKITAIYIMNKLHQRSTSPMFK